jgi:type IV pilus assembly protein PilP
VSRKRVLSPRNRAIGGYYFRALLLAGVALLFICGCEGGSKPPKVTVVKKDRSPKPEVAPKKEEEKAVAEKKEPPYTYNPVGKRDPFKPFIALGPKKPLPPKTPLTPLQRYDVSELKLVGILKGPKGFRALVEDAGGKGFIIATGTLIGRGDGRVKEIHENRVVIEETYTDIFGQIKRREISMPLRKPEEGGVK